MELTPDGHVNVGTILCNDCSSKGEFTVADGAIHFAASDSHRAASYQVFVTRQEEQPMSLRFESVGFDSMYERRTALDGQTVFPVESVAQPVAADLVGTWRWQYDEFYFQFRDDGTFSADESRDNLDSDTVQDLGQFQLDGTLLTLTSGEATRVCGQGEVGVYEAGLTEDGQLQLILQEDACPQRRAPSTNPQFFDRVN
jgi:hypothetical protein